MSIRASRHGGNARHQVFTISLAFLRNRESRSRFLYSCAQAIAPIALVVGLVLVGSALRHDALTAGATTPPIAAAGVVSSAVP